MTPPLHVSPDDARQLDNDPGHPSVRMLSHGTMEVRWYRPAGEERHLPHDRDEVYFVVGGSATFYRSEDPLAFSEEAFRISDMQQVSVGLGDVVFVPAGSEHWFDDLSPDFAAWTIFWGPEGGERS